MLRDTVSSVMTGHKGSFFFIGSYLGKSPALLRVCKHEALDCLLKVGLLLCLDLVLNPSLQKLVARNAVSREVGLCQAARLLGAPLRPVGLDRGAQSRQAGVWGKEDRDLSGLSGVKPRAGAKLLLILGIGGPNIYTKNALSVP